MEEKNEQQNTEERTRTHQPWEFSESKIHHRHAPNLSRVTHGFMWKLAHLYWPMYVHFMTDKYHGRLHHLVVDIIYGVVSLTLLFANIGLAIWFYLYYTPADIQVRVQAPAVVRSGQDMLVTADYVNGGRDIENVSIDFILPEGFLFDEEHEQPPFELGELDEGEAGQVFARGQVFGSVGTTYDALAIIRYTSFGREYSQVEGLEFTVNVASFEMELILPEAVTYNVPITAIVKYKNASAVDRTNVRLHLDLPNNFIVTSIRQGDLVLFYDSSTGEVTLPGVAAGEEGELIIEGRFLRGADELVGDMHQQFSVSAITSLDTPAGVIDEEYRTGASGTAFDVVVPRVALDATAIEAVQFGETIYGSVTVQNIGDEAVTAVDIRAQVTGDPVSARNLIITQRGDERITVLPNASLSNATVSVFPDLIDSIEPGQSVTVRYQLPTTTVDGQQVASQIAFSGFAYVPIVSADIPVIGESVETKYNSRVSLDATAIYYGPSGEQLGFGPYPAQAWEETAMRVLLRVTNSNNPLSNVRLTTQLPGQVDWTDLFSVSAGTEMTFDENTRTVTWIVPTLEPSETGYGAQFEVIIYPNHLQVGQQPHLVNQIEITATDAFTGASIYQSEGAVVLPQPITE